MFGLVTNFFKCETWMELIKFTLGFFVKESCILFEFQI